ncbi:helix-turn-helix domain-containing protein [Pseudodesulfovibrio sediminis]|uniref:XRE family transcriptional regulator n=1 Tax=Pseudodesulfovibrio sediminis TaxID=2810563 RepID=A0ABN6EP49_9BACT|nr:helix-turn-helix transcriptional regulator [Pseudodesulfovibrio sediminis]BCS88178.1 XRE family transcriptional regulator [Pseudodesulfovibrio sediminis]
MSALKVRLGKRIRELRTAQNLSQDKLAERVGISGKYLGEVERGEGNVSVEKLEKITVALDVTIGSLLDNAHMEDRSDLIKDIGGMLDKAEDAEVRLVHRLVSDVLR